MWKSCKSNRERWSILVYSSVSLFFTWMREKEKLCQRITSSNWFLLSQSNDAFYHQKHLDRDRIEHPETFSRHLRPFCQRQSSSSRGTDILYRYLLVFREKLRPRLSVCTSVTAFSLSNEGEGIKRPFIGQRWQKKNAGEGKEFYILTKVLLDLKRTSV